MECSQHALKYCKHAFKCCSLLVDGIEVIFGATKFTSFALYFLGSVVLGFCSPCLEAKNERNISIFVAHSMCRIGSVRNVCFKFF
jgi:hypothetical protein